MSMKFGEIIQYIVLFICSKNIGRLHVERKKSYCDFFGKFTSFFFLSDLPF